MPFQPLHLHKTSAAPVTSLSADFYSILIRKQKEINKKVTEYGLQSEDQELKAQAEIQKRQQELRQANEAKEKKEEEDKRWQVLCIELSAFLRSRSKKSINNEADNDNNQEADVLDSILLTMSNRRFESSNRSAFIGRFQDEAISSSTWYQLLTSDLQALAQLFGRFGYGPSTALTSHIQSALQFEETIRATILKMKGTKKREQANFRPELEKFFEHPLFIRLSQASVNELENAIEATSQKRALGSGSETGSIFVQAFPYIAKQKLAFEHLETDGIEFSTEETTTLQTIFSIIHNPLNFSPDSQADPLSSSSSSSSSPLKISLLQIIRLAQEISNQLQNFPRNSSSFSGACQRIQQEILTRVQQDNKSKGMDSSGYHATLICAIYRVLPSANQRKTWSGMLQTYIQSLPICIPDLSDQRMSIDDQLATIRLYSSILAYQILPSTYSGIANASNNNTDAVVNNSASTVSPLPISFAWRWLHRLTQQLYVLITHRRISSSNSASPAATFDIELMVSTNIALVFNAFLMRTGHALSVFYQDTFLSFLKLWQQEFFANNQTSLVLKGFDDVKMRLQTMISKQGVSAPMYYLHQDPYVLDTLWHQQQSIVSMESEMAAWEMDRTSPFMQRVKALQIDRLRAVFNRMGATPESREASIKTLLEKIVLASKESPEMLRYTLFKVVQNVVNDCQDSNFNEMIESHPMKLARVICSVGKEITQLTDIFKSEFLRICPFLVPRVISEGIDETSNMLSLGFVLNKNTRAPESSESWMKRMGKLFATAVVIAIQPEQIVFTLETLWTLLARVTNQMLRMSNKPPFFIAMIYEMILRIAGKKLNEKYGPSFMQLLKIIESQVIPKFGESKSLSLGNVIVFVSKFLKSNGQEFLGFFNERVDIISAGDSGNYEEDFS